MAVKCQACPLRSKSLFIPMSDDELQATQMFKAGELEIDAGATILMEGSSSPQLFTVLRGMGLRYKTLPDGKRQVTNFVFPGDFLGLQAAVMDRMQHSVEASTRMTLCVFDRSEVFRFFRDHPERAFDITWLAAAEEHFLGEALTYVGQQTAEGRLAWAILKIFARLKSIGMVQNATMPLPYRQQDMADALGMSLVHLNKTLAKLRERQLLTWTDRRVHIHDREGLVQLAMVEDDGETMRPLL